MHETTGEGVPGVRLLGGFGWTRNGVSADGVLGPIVTDDNGRFVLRGDDAERYHLSIEHDSLVLANPRSLGPGWRLYMVGVQVHHQVL